MHTLERRAHPRYPFVSKGKVICPETTYTGTLLDISLYGAMFGAHFIGTAAPGTKCVLVVLNLKDEVLFGVNGSIAYAEHGLVGIEFSPLDDDLQDRIRQITFLNLAPASYADRELPALLKPALTNNTNFSIE